MNVLTYVVNGGTLSTAALPINGHKGIRKKTFISLYTSRLARKKSRAVVYRIEPKTAFLQNRPLFIIQNCHITNKDNHQLHSYGSNKKSKD